MGASGVGMPALLRLDAFAWRIHEAFGDTPYLVGSANHTTKWRDVDVRLILDDAEYDVLFGGPMHSPRDNLRWALICDAISELGRQMTGLPIDFQIQRQTEANKEYPDGWRNPLGLRMANQPWDRQEAAQPPEEET